MTAGPFRGPLSFTGEPLVLSHGGTPGSPVFPLLASAGLVLVFEEPAERTMNPPVFPSVSLPAGKAGLRRRIALAFERLPRMDP
jgi:hypothetical protein